jgi:hypothetical protein
MVTEQATGPHDEQPPGAAACLLGRCRAGPGEQALGIGPGLHGVDSHDTGGHRSLDQCAREAERPTNTRERKTEWSLADGACLLRGSARASGPRTSAARRWTCCLDLRTSTSAGELRTNTEEHEQRNRRSKKNKLIWSRIDEMKNP